MLVLSLLFLWGEGWGGCFSFVGIRIWVFWGVLDFVGDVFLFGVSSVCQVSSKQNRIGKSIAKPIRKLKEMWPKRCLKAKLRPKIIMCLID